MLNLLNYIQFYLPQINIRTTLRGFEESEANNLHPTTSQTVSTAQSSHIQAHMTSQKLYLLISHGPGYRISRDPVAQQHSRMEHLGSIYHSQAQKHWIGKQQLMMKMTLGMDISRDLQKVLIQKYNCNQNLTQFLQPVSCFTMPVLLKVCLQIVLTNDLTICQGTETLVTLLMLSLNLYLLCLRSVKQYFLEGIKMCLKHLK